MMYPNVFVPLTLVLRSVCSSVKYFSHLVSCCSSSFSLQISIFISSHSVFIIALVCLGCRPFWMLCIAVALFLIVLSVMHIPFVKIYLHTHSVWMTENLQQKTSHTHKVNMLNNLGNVKHQNASYKLKIAHVLIPDLQVPFVRNICEGDVVTDFINNHYTPCK